MKTLIFRTLIATVTMLAALASTSHAEDSAVPKLADQIQPRNPDAIWNYAGYYMEDGKAERDGVTVEEIVDTREIDGVTCYLVRLTFDYRSLPEKLMGVPLDDDSFTYFWEYFNENGSYNYSCDWELGAEDLPESLSEFDLTLPYPVKAGHKYTDSSGDSWQVLNTSKEVETPLGTFECVVYQCTYTDEADPSSSTRDRYYQAPGVGLVRYEWYEKLDGEHFKLSSYEELYDYDLDTKN